MKKHRAGSVERLKVKQILHVCSVLCGWTYGTIARAFKPACICIYLACVHVNSSQAWVSSPSSTSVSESCNPACCRSDYLSLNRGPVSVTPFNPTSNLSVYNASVLTSTFPSSKSGDENKHVLFFTESTTCLP